MPDKILISKIINLREAKDWSQAELARRLGVEKSVMNKIENGSRKVSIDELKQLANLFQVSTDYLLGFERGSTGEKMLSEKQRFIAGYIDAEMTDDQLDDVVKFIEFVKVKKK